MLHVSSNTKWVKQREKSKERKIYRVVKNNTRAERPKRRKIYRVVKNNNTRAERPKRIPNQQNTLRLVDQINIAGETRKRSQLCINVSEVGNEWLTRSAIAKLSPLRSMAYMQDHLKNLGYSDIQVHPIDANKVVPTFPNIEDRDSVFNGGKMSWLKDCFLEIQTWDDTISTQGGDRSGGEFLGIQRQQCVLAARLWSATARVHGFRVLR
ncbi:hypothetical protein RHSIM_Rhsim01G0057700 [Rhododendron simsii]|uniref:Uncharacterized protein n=1 Tax=Rhododendron simsii TaxID=118357 RepID=A0A834HUU1_RHOSS|nr:hypothetical protein RHSIM_Rhsim01G0057700 [Rhododendron simsii]